MSANLTLGIVGTFLSIILMVCGIFIFDEHGIMAGVVYYSFIGLLFLISSGCIVYEIKKKCIRIENTNPEEEGNLGENSLTSKETDRLIV